MFVFLIFGFIKVVNVMSKVSVYMSFFRDFTYLDKVVEQFIDFADEIILVDGPNFSTLAGFASAGVALDKKSCITDLQNNFSYFNDDKVKPSQIPTIS